MLHHLLTYPFRAWLDIPGAQVSNAQKRPSTKILGRIRSMNPQHAAVEWIDKCESAMYNDLMRTKRICDVASDRHRMKDTS
jgi:hypothetical protein